MPDKSVTVVSYAAGASLAAVALIYVFAPTFTIDNEGGGASSRKKSIIGLRNQANDCFINSVLQALAGLGELRVYLIRETHRRSIEDSAVYASLVQPEGKEIAQWKLQGLQEGLVTHGLKEMLDALNERPIYRKSISPFPFVKVLEVAFKQRISRQQQDAQEFLQIVAERLKDEYHSGQRARLHARRRGMAASFENLSINTDTSPNGGAEVGGNDAEETEETKVTKEIKEVSPEETMASGSNVSAIEPSTETTIPRIQASDDLGQLPLEMEEGFPMEGKYESHLQCQMCGYKTKPREETFCTITLAVPQVSSTSLNACFDGIFKTEYIDDFKCEKCRLVQTKENLQHELAKSTSESFKAQAQESLRKLQIAIDTDPEHPPEDVDLGDMRYAPKRKIAKTTRMSLFPGILAIHLSRSIYGAQVTQKNSAKVSFPEELPLGGLMDQRRYRLRGLVTHRGGHNSGHYEAFRRQNVAAPFSNYNTFQPSEVYSKAPTPISTPEISTPEISARDMDSPAMSTPDLLSASSGNSSTPSLDSLPVPPRSVPAESNTTPSLSSNRKDKDTETSSLRSVAASTKSAFSRLTSPKRTTQESSTPPPTAAPAKKFRKRKSATDKWWRVSDEKPWRLVKPTPQKHDPCQDRFQALHHALDKLQAVKPGLGRRAAATSNPAQPPAHPSPSPSRPCQAGACRDNMDPLKRRKRERVKDWILGGRPKSSTSQLNSSTDDTALSGCKSDSDESGDAGRVGWTSRSPRNSETDVSVVQTPLVATKKGKDKNLEDKNLEDKGLQHNGLQDEGLTDEGRKDEHPSYVSTVGQDLWERAKQELKEDERELLEGNVQLGATRDILSQLDTIMQEKQQQVEAKTWKFDFGGRKIVLRDVVGKIIGLVKTFKDFGDAAATIDPIHCALPWAAVKFVLQIATADLEQAGQALIGIELVTCLINRGMIYERLYIVPDPSTGVNAIQELQKSIVLTYKSILSFLASYIKLMGQNTFKRTIVATIDPKMLGDMLANLGKYEARCEVAASNCERLVSSLSRNRQDANQEQLRNMLKDHIRQFDASANRFWKKLGDDERCKILQWISEVPFESDHYSAAKGRVKGTGQWLLDHPTYKQWRLADSSTILWLNGIPGAGKTKLSSKVIDDILARTTDASIQEAFAYFYCDRNRTDHRDPVVVLRSLVRQFSASRDELTIIPYVEEKYIERKRTGFARDQLTSEECQELLLRLTNDYLRCTIVIDGLDECDRETRCVLMDVLDLVVSKSSQPVKTYIASRQDQDLRLRYQGGNNLEVTANNNQADIEKYVLKKLQQSSFCRDKMTYQVRQEVLRTFDDKSQGMFQWAAIHIDELLKLELNSDILDYLDKLPKGLEAAYTKIYTSISSQAGSRRSIALSAFKVLMCSWRPLSPAEMVIAATQDANEDFRIDPDVDIDYVLDACRNFMVVADGLPDRLLHDDDNDNNDSKQEQQANNTKFHEEYRFEPIIEHGDKDEVSAGNAAVKPNSICRFAHLSIREYFELHHWSIAEANAHMACICLRTLLRLRWDGLPLEDDETSDASSRGSSEGNEARVVVTNPLLDIKLKDRRVQYQLVQEDSETGSVRSLGQDERSKPVVSSPEAFNPPPFLCTLELCQIHTHTQGAVSVCSSVEFDAYIESYQGAALEKWSQYASEAWSLHVRRAKQHTTLRSTLYGLLLKFIGEPKFSSSPYRAWTVFNEGRTNLTLDRPERSKTLNLFDKGHSSSLANFPELRHFFWHQFHRNLIRPTCDAVLGCAVLGLDHLLEQWLEAGEIDANYYTARGNSLLHLAVQGGHLGACKILLSHGANPNDVGRELYTPLQAAVYNHRPDILKVLLKGGADPDLQPSWRGKGHFGRFPLSSAVMFAQIDSVKILLRHGASVDTSEALQDATRGGNARIVQLLLDNLSPLGTAAKYEKAAVDRRNLLLRAWDMAVKADVENVEILDLFLDRGIDMKANCSIHSAVSFGHIETTRWLIRHGLDINQKSDVGGETPLHALVRRTDETNGTDVVQAARDAVAEGARINEQDDDGYTPLHLAVKRVHAVGGRAILRYFLETSADADTQNLQGETVLVTACFQCSLSDIVKLLDRGLDVNKAAGPGSDYITPLLAASRRGEGPSTTLVLLILLEAGAKYKLENYTDLQRQRLDGLSDLEETAKGLLPDLKRKAELKYVPWRFKDGLMGPEVEDQEPKPKTKDYGESQVESPKTVLRADVSVPTIPSRIA
ncbi:hypothetical protein G7046_g1935 [Stylonectria norvegica]|nr:hypothetical protein G7046_g1935 [Stylonectria norvegica]